MPLVGSLDVFDRGEAFAKLIGSESVDVAAIGTPPCHRARCEKPVGPLEKLQKLPTRIDVAVSRGIDRQPRRIALVGLLDL